MTEKRHRVQVATLLLVGEGSADEAFLKHLKGLYVVRGAGWSVTVRSAGGKGAKHVVDWTIRQIGDFDRRACLLDTDVDWNAAVAAKARSGGVTVLRSEPQLEAMLLRVLGVSDTGNSDALKRRLAKWIPNGGFDPGDYSREFDRSCLERARTKEATIGALLDLLTAPPQLRRR